MTRTVAQWVAVLSFVVSAGGASARPAASGQDQTGPPQQPLPYTLVADPGQPLEGVQGVRLLAAMSAPEAEACEVLPTAVEEAANEPLRAAGIPIIDATTLTDAAAAAVPELFVSLTVIRDETRELAPDEPPVCAASLLVQLGVDTNVVLIYRNADSAPGTLRLSNAYAELDRSGTLLVGVPPTFGNEVQRAVAGQVEGVAAVIVAANPDLAGLP